MTDITFDLHHREVYETFMEKGIIWQIQNYLEESQHDELSRISFYQGYETNRLYMSYYMPATYAGYRKLEHVKAIELLCIDHYRLVDMNTNELKITLEFEEIK